MYRGTGRLSILLALPDKDFNFQEYFFISGFLKTRGYALFIASDAGGACRGDNGSIVQPDIRLYNVRPGNFDAIVLIGGKGVTGYYDNRKLLEIIKEFFISGKPVGAICAASVLPVLAGLLDGKEFTCHPDYKKFTESAGALYTGRPVTLSGNIVTGRDQFAAGHFVNIFTGLLEGK